MGKIKMRGYTYMACLSLGATAASLASYAKKQDDYTIAAYVWPSCHSEESYRNILWPEGIGEWEVIQKGTPRFEGHYQPKLPLWGYEMDDDPKVMEKWIEAATDHGVNVFIFDWYWFDGKPFLENALNNGFLQAANRDAMQFYVMWANHDVRRNYWNVHKYKDDSSILWKGAVDWDNFQVIVQRIIRQYFSQPNYFKIEGKPVFSIYHLNNLVEGLGGTEETRKALDYLRAETERAGYPGLHLQTIGNGNPSEELVERIEALGFDSVTKYNWGGPHPEDYLQWGSEAGERRKNWDEALGIPFFPNVSIGWDATPRFPQQGKAHVVHYNKTPEAFAGYLQQARSYCDQYPGQPNLITLFAWNEWIEGAYLLPDLKYGFSYLEAVEAVMSGAFDPYTADCNRRGN